MPLLSVTDEEALILKQVIQDYRRRGLKSPSKQSPPNQSSPIHLGKPVGNVIAASDQFGTSDREFTAGDCNIYQLIEQASGVFMNFDGDEFPYGFKVINPTLGDLPKVWSLLVRTTQGNHIGVPIWGFALMTLTSDLASEGTATAQHITWNTGTEKFTSTGIIETVRDILKLTSSIPSGKRIFCIDLGDGPGLCVIAAEC